MGNPSKLLSILNCKCPRCRTGNMFQYPSYNLLKFSKGNDNCPHCGLRFEHETGFFWAAMYISYCFSAGLMIVIGIVGINLGWSFNKIMGIILPSAIILTPYSFRYSRVLVMYLISPNRKFKPEYL